MTKTELAIQELWKTVAKLEIRVDTSRSDIKDIESDFQKIEDRRIEAGQSISDIEKRIVLVEEAVKELKKERETKDTRRWTIIVAIVSCLLTLAAQAILADIKSTK